MTASTPQDSRPMVGNRRRARRACLACRARKVRCDVVLRGPPCTNCKLDHDKCVVKPRQHKGHTIVAWAKAQQGLYFKELDQQSVDADARHDETSEVQKTSPIGGRCPDANQKPETPTPPDVENVTSTSQSSPLPEIQSLVEFDNSFPGFDITGLTLDGFFDYPNTNAAVDIPDSTVPEIGLEEGDVDELEALSQQASPDLARSKIIRSPPHQSAPTLQPTLPQTGGKFLPFPSYPFIRSDLLWNLSPEESSFLDQIGCLHLPIRSAMDELVRQYFLYVHPTFPIINEHEIWTCYNAQPHSPVPSGGISLFVFQAMLFLACPFVSPSTLGVLGFSSVRRARQSFYVKAKHLFHVDRSRCGIESAQGALMLTYHAPSIDDTTNGYWLSTAIHFARSVNAHRYNELDEDSEDRNTLKRLWWCCILRDRIMALSLRRLLQIRPGDFDFNEPGLVEADLRDEIRGSLVYDPCTKKVVVQLAASLCELAATLNDVLTVCCPPNGRTVRLPKSPIGETQELLALVSKLDGWYEIAVARFQVPSMAQNTQSSLSLFTHAVYIYYHTAKAYVCNHIMLLSLTGPHAQGSGLYEKLRALDGVDQALSNITQSLKELEEMGLIKYLPNSFVAFSALPFMWRVSDAGFTHFNDSQEKEKDLEVFDAVFRRFQKLYEITDSVLQYIDYPMKTPLVSASRN